MDCNWEKRLSDMSVGELEEEVSKHNQLYWDQDRPQISDEDYDRLIRVLAQRDPSSSLLENLGPIFDPDRQGAIRHLEPMLSLDKCYDGSSLKRWAAKINGEITVTPKLDGVAVSVRYDDKGKLEVAATRGNGLVGDEITRAALMIGDIPNSISLGGAEIRGEVYMRLSIFESYGGKFASPRNLAAGLLKRKVPIPAAENPLAFIAYDLLGTNQRTESGKLDLIGRLGLDSIEHLIVQKDELEAAHKYFLDTQDRFDFAIDGVVFKANILSEQRCLGVTAHHPRFAIAYKLHGDTKISQLLDVEWSVSRTGVVTPVAIIAPTPIGGVVIGRASLHNAGHVRNLDLRYGDLVGVSRRGDVIPKIEFVHERGQESISFPSNCPACRSKAVMRGDLLFCSAADLCSGVATVRILHYCRKLSIDGFGAKLVQKAYEKGLLRSPPDLYLLDSSALRSLDRVSERLARRLLGQVESSRAVELDLFLDALGIEDLGPQIAKLLVTRFSGLRRIQDAKLEELAEMPLIGELRGARIRSGLKRNQIMIARLLEQVTLIDAPRIGAFEGKRVVFTGKLAALQRSRAKVLVRKTGGEVLDSPSGGCDYLVVGGRGNIAPSAKERKALELNAKGAAIQIIDEREFLALIGIEKDSSKEH